MQRPVKKMQRQVRKKVNYKSEHLKRYKNTALQAKSTEDLSNIRKYKGYPYVFGTAWYYSISILYYSIMQKCRLHGYTLQNLVVINTHAYES